MGHDGRVADRRSAAQIAVVQLCAIFIRLALAINRVARTQTFAAGVVHGTWISIIAAVCIEFRRTIAKPVAKIVCAGIFVITNERLTDTDSFFAVISGRTRVPVKALAFAQVSV